MKFVCNSGEKTWFRLETEYEASQESLLMGHAVEKYFCATYAKAKSTYQPGQGIERDIGLKAHIERSMPLFLTLRDAEGGGLATAMLPPNCVFDPAFHPIIVGPHNSDPYIDHAAAIADLGAAIGMKLPRDGCYPYA